MDANRPGAKWGDARIAFRVIAPRVAEALRAGRSVLSVYEEMKPHFPGCYSRFAHYVQRAAMRTMVRDSAVSLPAQSPARHAVPAATAFAGRSVGGPPIPLTSGSGPPTGRPEDAVPTIDMDRFAAQALKNEDLF